MRSHQELEHILYQYDSAHAKEGGLAGAARNLFKEAGPQGMIASDIVNQLFPELPIEDRAALGDILDRDLTSGGGRWLHSLITGEKVGYGLITGP